MKTFPAALFLTALALVAPAHAAGTTGPVPILPHRPITEPPPFIPNEPSQVNPAQDLDRLLKLLDDDEEEKAPKAKCDVRPCVLGYRFSDRVSTDSARKFEKFIGAAVAAKADAVMVEINTPGGSITDGHEISRQIEHAPLMVVCVVDGMNFSMGMYILQSCDVRVMTKRSSLMVHQAALMAPAGTRLTQRGMEELQTQLMVVTRGYIEWVAHRMKISVQDVLARVSGGREWYMSWEEALKVGAVDKVIDGPPEAYLQQLKTKGP